MSAEKELCRQTLSGNAFLQVNKQLMKVVGIEGAILISDLLSKEKYFEDRGQLEEDGSFFNTQDNIEKDSCLTPHLQRKAITALKKVGILNIRRKGVPAKNYYLICHNKILKLLTSRYEYFSQLDVDGFNTNKNKEIRIKNNYISVIEFWNKQNGLISHNIKSASKNLGKKHIDIIEDIGEEKVKKAIENYAEIISNDMYWFSYKWSLWDFIGRKKVYNFIDEASPFENYKDKNAKDTSERDNFLKSLEDELKKEQREK